MNVVLRMAIILLIAFIGAVLVIAGFAARVLSRQPFWKPLTK
jgi:hypothetical protein